MMSIADLEKIIDRSKPIMFDTETVGFYGKIRLGQFFQDGWTLPVVVENPNPFELVSLLTNLIVVCHNAAYDISCIQEGCGKSVWMPIEFHDTFLLARLHFYLKEGFSLDKVVQYTLGYNPYEHNDQQESDWSVPVLSEEQLEYAAMDVVYLLDVWNAVNVCLDDYNYKLDLLMTRYCLDFQNNGMPIDVDKLDEVYASNMQKIKELGLTINCNSYKQVRAYINSTMSDDEGLAKLTYQGNERAKQVRDVRKLTKNNSFLTGYRNTMIDEVIYGKFKVGARSGRTTCSDDNLQQIPRSLKTIFGVASDGDTVIVFSDFAQIQLRCVCAVTGDTSMEMLFRQGKDLHDYVAELTFGADFTPDNRVIAKEENFSLLFGAGVIVFINVLVKKAGLWLTELEATKLKKKWLGLWKHIAAWQTKGIKDWKKGIAWSTPLGRKYTSKMMTDQLAMQIQGFEAEVAKLATHYMWPKVIALNNEIPNDKPKVKLRNFMHDSYLFTCWKNEETYKKLCIIVADCMQEAWVQMCQNVTITDLPMPVKVRVGYNWNDVDKKDIFIFEHKQ